MSDYKMIIQVLINPRLYTKPISLYKKDGFITFYNPIYKHLYYKK